MSDIAAVNSAVIKNLEIIPPGEKPVQGAAAIGEVVNLTPDQTYHLLNKGEIKCAVKKGGRWFAFPTALRLEFLAA